MEKTRTTSSPLDENSMMRLLYFEVQIERHGPKWCAKNFVGAMRRQAETPRLKAMVVFSDKDGRSFQEVRQSTARRLATFCAMCRKCDMALTPPE